MKTRLYSTILSTGALIAAQPVHAQTAPSTPAATTPDATTAPTAADTGIADIVVTAQRRSENLQRAAIAVTAVTADQLAEKGVVKLQELTKLAPALKVAGISGGGTQVTIRGVGSFVGNAFSDSGVAINYDGVYLARSNSPNGLFYDLDRVEVLKGPQGTLYGRNSTAGAVNIITKKPTDELAAEVTGEVGNYDLFRGSAMVNVPLADGIALRVAGQAITRDGYFSDGYDDDKGYAGRAQLKVAPTGSDFSLLLSADYSKQKGMGDAAVFSPFQNPKKPYTGPTSPASNGVLAFVSSLIGVTLPPFTTDGFLDNHSWGVSATMEWKPGPIVVTFLPAYRETKADYLHYGPGFPVNDNQTAKQTSAELRLSSPGGGRFNWIVGGYYFKEDSETFLDAEQGVASSRLDIPQLDTESYAAFGQLTYSIADHLRLTGGARYTHEHKTVNGSQTTPLPGVPAGFPFPAAVFYALACPAPATFAVPPVGICTSPISGDQTFEKVTWKAGVEADVGPQSLLYASVSTGFKAGGFYPSLAPNTYRPENLRAYTIGSKNRFFGNTLQVNVEAFYWDYTDKQISHLGPIRPAGYNLITENAGKAEIYGLEAEIVWQPTSEDQLILQPQYQHSKYKQFQYSLSVAPGALPATSCPTVKTGTDGAGLGIYRVDCSGRTLPLAPKWVLGASYRHTFPLASGAKFIAGASTRVESSYVGGEEYLPGQIQKSEMVSDLDLTFVAPNGRFSVTGYVQNLENKAVIQNSFVQPAIGQPLVTLRPPRTYGLRASVRF